MTTKKSKSKSKNSSRSVVHTQAYCYENAFPTLFAYILTDYWFKSLQNVTQGAFYASCCTTRHFYLQQVRTLFLAICQDKFLHAVAFNIRVWLREQINEDLIVRIRFVLYSYCKSNPIVQQLLYLLWWEENEVIPSTPVELAGSLHLWLRLDSCDHHVLINEPYFSS